MMRNLCYLPLVLVLLLSVSCGPSSTPVATKKRADYHYYLGVSHIEDNNPSGALQELIKAEKIDSNDDKIYAALAQAYTMKRAYALAEKNFLRAYELSDNNPKYQNNLGAVYLSAERYDDAIRAFQTAAQNLLFQNSEIAWTGAGFAYYQKGNYAAAERAYLKAEAENDQYFQAPFRLGELYYTQERPVEAVDSLLKATLLAPQFVDGHYWLGLAYMKAKDPEKAKVAFQKVIELAPESDQARLAENYLKIIE